MVDKKVISALFIAEVGEVRCGYCGKNLCYLQKNSKKSKKSIDNQNYSAIIKMKCGRCSHENEMKIT